MNGLWEEKSVLRGYFHYSTIPYVNSVYRGDLLIKLEYTYIKESCLI